MLLTRLALVSLLLCGTLPCLAQDGVVKRAVQPSMVSQASLSASFLIFAAPSSISTKTAPRTLESAQAAGGPCYSIRDYRFAANSKSAMPTLQRYSICESALLFHMREVIIAPRR